MPNAQRQSDGYMKKFCVSCFYLAVVALLKVHAFAGTDIHFEFNPAIPGTPTIDTMELERQVQDILDLNGPYISNSFALANITGYPVGKATLGGFPHFQAGVAMGAGFTNMKYFDKNDPASNDGSLPGISANPVLHLGFGLTERTDIICKLFLFNSVFISSDVGVDEAKLSDFTVFSIGAKLRYNIIPRQLLIPFIFNFGGVTISLGGDMMYGDIKVHGTYDTDFENIDVDLDGAGGNPPVNVATQFSGDYDSRVVWGIVSATVQALAYFDIMYFFSLYTGVGLTGNMGYFKVEFDGVGDLSSNDPAYSGAGGVNPIGTMTFLSKNSYVPYYIVPTYVIGLEINLFVLKLTVETMVNLYNREDVNAQAGIRVQI